ncbi:MAG: phosphopantothenoylcysteine decarboxylase [Oscillospiraceae bacterium]|nr:phosphopantothenoylcysteine decarboxylase [Oscillospiraceae bacterium]
MITAGGTTEQIDQVRGITNQSTGSLGRAIAEAFLRRGEVRKIYYICGKSAVLPQELERVEILRILNVEDLKNEVTRLLLEQRLDGVVHCMAVSDYAVFSVTSTAIVEEQMRRRLKELCPSEPDYEQKASAAAGACLLHQNDLAKSGKISSDMDDLVVVMKRTPKIIGLFQQLQPEAVLVGFKLLNRVPAETLRKAGFDLMRKNSCDFVFANDLAEVSPEDHKGYFLCRDLSWERVSGRENIADLIASQVLMEAKKRGGE